MANAEYTVYDRLLHLTKKLPEQVVPEAEILLEEKKVKELLGLAAECHCISKAQARTMWEWVMRWDRPEGGVPEPHPTELRKLGVALGLIED